MIPRRLSPPASPLPGPSPANPRTSPSPSAADNLASTGSVSPTAQAQPGQLPQTGTIADSSTAFGPGRQRRLPSPVTPRPTRPRTDAATLPAMPATSPRSHAALQQQAQAFSAIAKALGHFSGMRWVTIDEAHRQALLAVATGMKEAEQRQQHLHEMLSSIQQTVQDMDWLASRHQRLAQVIDPALLTASVSAVHYGRVTIDGPHRDEAGQAHFYLEQQYGHACAQHAVNAMVGGPLVSLSDLAQYEAETQAPQEAMPTSRQGIAAYMLLQGVQVETVQGTLQERGIPTHCHAHVPLAHVQGLDPVQARFLDGLQTDRLLLQADRYEGDSTSSHYVAFRRDGGQWVLLDSLHHAPQYGVAPSAYLLGDERIKNFTALWPQHALQGQDAPVAVGGMEHDRQEGADRDAHEERGWQDRPVLVPSAPARIAYPIKTAQDHWKGQRAQEFEPLRQAWNVATGKKAASGGAFLRHLSTKCDEALVAGGGKPVDEAGLIFAFEVQTHPQGKTIQVWRGVNDNGSINLRLAPTPEDDDARKALLTAMQQSAKKSASQRREKPTGSLPYSSHDATHHWKGSRAKEFEPMRQAWNVATGTLASGGAFLQHLSAKCDEALDAGRSKLVDEESLIFEFEVKTHPEGEAIRVWRGVDGNGTINLRLAPEPGDDEARKALLTAMQQSAKKSATLRREKPADGLPYPSKNAHSHWKGPRAKEFEPLRQAWNEATGTSASGGAFLQHLSAQCDEARKAGAGKSVDKAGLIFEFEVKTHPEGEAMRVWRGVDGNGTINLRLAPKPGDDEARKALLRDMQHSAKKSAGRRKEKPMDGLTLEIDNRGEI